MSYFTAVLARDRPGDGPPTTSTSTARPTSRSSPTELRGLDRRPTSRCSLLVEREDAWWAVVRVDGDEDPRVFVSDLAGAAASPYADVLDRRRRRRRTRWPTGTCGGDLDVLADLGTSPEALQEMCDDELLPMDALAAVAEAAGFAEVLDSLR